MNNKAKKPVLFLLCLTATLAALSACGKKTTKTNITTTPKDTTQSKTTENKTTSKNKVTKIVSNNPVVFFIVDGQIYDQVEYTPSSIAIREPEVPTKEGYQITKWSEYQLTGDDVYVFAMYFKANTKYTVNYYLQNLENDEYTLKSDDTQTFTTTPDQVIKPNIKTYEGFSCINNDVELNIVEDESKNTINVYYDRIKYDINYDLDNGSDVITYNLKYGATIPTIATPEKDGYVFSKYTINGVDADLTKPVSKDLNIKATYTANTNTKYTVKYYQENMYDDGYTLVSADTETKTGTTDTNASFTVNPNKYEGFTVDSENTVSSGIIKGDESLELSIYYKRNKYNITYKYGIEGKEDVIETVKYDALAENKETTRAGYVFNGWMEATQTSIFNFATTKITRDYTLVAKYTPNSGIAYKVNTYYENADDDNYTLGNSYTLSGSTGQEVTVNTNTYAKNNFAYNAEMSNIKGNILADGSLELNVYYTRKAYTINFYDRYTNNLYTTVTVKYGSTPGSLPAELQRAGYTLQEFNDQTLGGAQSTYSELLNFIYGYNGAYGYERVVKVRYTANTDTVYKIKLYYENIEDDNYTFIEELTLTGTTDSVITPEQIDHFVFDHASGYTEEDGLIIKGDGSTAIKAYYNRERYTITFDTGIEGVSLDPIKNVKYETNINEPVLVREGYTISSWWSNVRSTFDFINIKAEYNENIECRWTAKTNTKYTVKHYIENIDDDGYTFYKDEIKEGTTDNEINDYNLDIDIEGFYYNTCNPAKIIINADGSSEICLYYKRNTYNVSVSTDSHVKIEINGKEGNSFLFRYGEKVKINAIFDNNLAYEYSGIYDATTEALITDSTEYEFTLGANPVSLIASSIIKPELENFSFTSDENNLIITGVNEWSEKLYIPDIATEIQYQLAYYNSTIKEVYIGKNVKKIGRQAFYYCTNLEKVTFASNCMLEEIEDNAFYQTAVTDITIPKSVKTIGEQVFRYSSLTTLIFEEGSNLEEIKNSAFYETNVKDVSLPNSLKKIGSNIFSSLSMDEFVISANLEEIGGYAFNGCKFNTLRFEENANRKEISEAAFYGVIMKKLYIPKDVEEICDFAFAHTYVEEVIFEEGSKLNAIYDHAFFYNKLNYLELPDNLQLIGAEAFYNEGYRISYIKVNANIGIIMDNAFYGSYPTIIINNSSKTFTIGEYTYGSIAKEATYIFSGDDINHILIDNDGFIYNYYDEEVELIAYIGKEREVIIPNCVTKISNNAFYRNQYIVKVIIPDSVTTIGESAFYSCELLTSVTIGSGVTEILDDAFGSDERLVEVINYSNLEIIKGSSEYGYIGCYAIDIVTDGYGSNVSIDNLFVKYISNDEVYLIKYIGQEIDEIEIPYYYTYIYKDALIDSDFKKLTIGNGVKTIGNNAFKNITTLEEIIFVDGSNLESIGEEAFAYCNNTKLTSIVLPKSLIEINEKAFYECNSLESLIFEDGSNLEIIKSYAFYSTKINQVVLPDSLIEIEEFAFSNCGKLESITLGANLKSIGRSAFNGDVSLNEVINNSLALEIIDENAFSNCLKLTSFTLNEVLTTINTSAFHDTNIVSIYNMSSLDLVKGSYEHGEIALKAIEIYSNIEDKKSYIEGDFVYYEELDELDNVIDLYLISYLGNSETVTISKDVTVIANSAFYGNEYIENIEFEDNSKLRVIKEYAFSNTSLATIELPNSLEIVEKGAGLFLNEDSNYNIKDSNKYLGNETNPYLYLVQGNNCEIDENCKIIGDSAYCWKSLNDLVIPDSVTFISPYAFYCSYFDSITLPENIDIISEATFYQVTVESITIPKNVKTIDKKAFMSSHVTEVLFEDGSMLETINEEAFYECDSLVTIVLPESLKTISDSAFYDCDVLQSITIPNSVEIIGEYAFFNCRALETVTINSNASLKEIGKNAFMNCINLASFNIPDSVLVIDNYAFYGCTNLTNLTINEDAELQEIGEYAFCNTNLSSVLISKDVTIIKDYAFNCCANLTTLTFASDSSLKEIGKYVFVDTAIENIVFPDSLEIIDEHAFDSLTSLTSIEFGEDSNLVEIGKYAFHYTSIEELVLPKSLETIKEFAFYNCNELLSVSVNDDSNLTLIESDSFEDCDNLQTVDLGCALKLKAISKNTFRSCNFLTDVILPEGLERIESYAFYYSMNANVDGCLYLPKSLKEIGELAFYQNSYLKTIYYTGTMEDWINISMEDDYSNPIYQRIVDFYIWDETINDYKLMTEIVIPEGVTSIREYAFHGIKNIDAIYLPASIEEIQHNALSGVNNITKIYYGSTISDWQFINMEATDANPIQYESVDFYTWDSENEEYKLVTDLVIAEGVTEIKKGAFAKINNISKIYLPASLERINEYAFSGLNEITEIYYAGTIESWLNIIMNGESTDSASNPCLISDSLNFYIWDESTNDYKLMNEIVIPEGVTSIRSFAFQNIQNIAKLYIPASLETINDDAFYGLNNIEEIYYNGTIEDWLRIEKTSYYSDPLYLNNVDFYIWDENINDYKLMTDIVISEGVTEIKDFAFYHIKNITAVYIPKSLEVSNYYAFSGLDEITDVYYTGAIDGWLSIDFSAEYSNPLQQNIVNFHIWDENDEEYKLVTELVIPEGVTEIKEYAFYHFDNITAIYIPKSLEKINYCAFDELVDIADIYYAGTIDEWINIDMSSDWANPLVNNEVDFHIWDSEDEEYKLLTEIVIPEGVTETKRYTFNQIKNITAIYFPKSFEKSDYSFYGLNEITNVYYAGSMNEWLNIDFTSDYSTPFNINVAKFHIWDENDGEYKLVDDIVLSEGITEIKEYAFRNMENITKVHIPKSLEKINYCAFTTLNEITEIYYAGTIEEWLDIDMVAYDANPLTHNDVDFYVWDNSINDYKLLTEIVLSNNVTSIKYSAFYHIKNINKVYLPQSISEINYDAFSGLNEITEIYYAGTIEEWLSIEMGNVFANPCYVTEDFDFYIWDNDVEDYTILSEIVIPEGVTEIKDHAFYNIKNISKVYIPNSVEKINDDAFFFDGSSLDELYYHGSLEEWLNIEMTNYYSNPLSNEGKDFYIWDYTDEEYKLLTEIVIPNTITTIKSYAFVSSNNIKYLFIPSSVESIEYNAFANIDAYYTRVYYEGTIEEFEQIDESSNIYSGYVYYYSENEPDDPDNKWHYNNDGEISEYNYERALVILDLLLEKANNYLTAAVEDGTHVGPYPTTDITYNSDEEMYTLRICALLHLLSIDDNEFYQEINILIDYDYYSSAINYPISGNKMEFIINNSYDGILGYYLVVTEDGNLALLDPLK